MRDWSHELDLPGLNVATVAGWLRPWSIVRAFAEFGPMHEETLVERTGISRSFAGLLRSRLPLVRAGVGPSRPGHTRALGLSASASTLVADIVRLSSTIAQDMAAAREGRPQAVVQGEETADLLRPLSTPIGLQVAFLLAESSEARTPLDLVGQVEDWLKTDSYGRIVSLTQVAEDLPSAINATMHQFEAAGLVTRVRGEPEATRRLHADMEPLLHVISECERGEACLVLARLTRSPAHPLMGAAIAVDAASGSALPIREAGDLAEVLGAITRTGARGLDRLDAIGVLRPGPGGIALSPWLHKVLALAVPAGVQATRRQRADLSGTIIELLADSHWTDVMRAINDQGSTAPDILEALKAAAVTGKSGGRMTPRLVDESLGTLLGAGVIQTVATSGDKVREQGQVRRYRLRAELTSVIEQLRRFPAEEFPSSAVRRLLPSMQDKVGRPSLIAHRAVVPSSALESRAAPAAMTNSPAQQRNVWLMLVAEQKGSASLASAEAAGAQSAQPTTSVPRSDMPAPVAVPDNTIAAAPEHVPLERGGEQSAEADPLTIALRLEVLTGIPAARVELIASGLEPSGSPGSRTLAWAFAELARQLVDPAPSWQSATLHGQLQQATDQDQRDIAYIAGVPEGFVGAIARAMIVPSRATADALAAAVAIAPRRRILAGLLDGEYLDDGQIETAMGICRVVSLGPGRTRRILTLQPPGETSVFAIATSADVAKLPPRLRYPTPREWQQIGPRTVDVILDDLRWTVARAFATRSGLHW